MVEQPNNTPHADAGLAEPWLGPDGSISPSNDSGGDYEFDLYDTTLRDGEQQAGVCLDADQKVRIFRAIEGAGIRYIETGMVAVWEDEQEVVRRLAAEGHKSRLFVLSRCLQSDIALAADCGVDGVTLELAANPAIAKLVLGWTRDELVRRATEAIAYAKSRNLEVNFFGIDASRTEVGWLCELFGRAVEVGADAVTIADTFGVLDTSGSERLTAAVKAVVNCPVQIHVHNDYGLATANSLAAVSAGARVVQGTFNGLGERAGNACLAEVAVAARFLKGWRPRVVLSELRAVAAIVAEETGSPIHWNEPVVGPNLFDIEAGIAAAFYEALQPIDLRHFYPFLPERIGATPRIVLGKGTGVASIRLKLRELGYPQPDEAAQRRLMARCKEIGTAHGRALTPDETLSVFQAELGVHSQSASGG